ncbi:MAG TPA: co-chaperone GroES [Candidatus Cloacimonadota bacterium]|nr:co-chaperone GroES [Candidatus Cloacimonadales bacterium]HOQ80029.1 co-chaperone GroES [Candidatus Cloacimonadota bacterium]HPK40699.1 co-chaperone GroES [Candidatus Cloacimonadota bacterium]HQB41747.1 co-chaperone GroES [Candidatus Cloacimonadota bacterium]
MTLKPIEDRVVIEIEDEAAEKNVGGIIIPDTAKDKPNLGKVIAVGTDEALQKIIKVGDRVIYAKYSGTEIEVEGKKLLIVSKDDILAIVA